MLNWLYFMQIVMEINAICKRKSRNGVLIDDNYVRSGSFALLGYPVLIV